MFLHHYSSTTCRHRGIYVTPSGSPPSRSNLSTGPRTHTRSTHSADPLPHRTTLAPSQTSNLSRTPRRTTHHRTAPSSRLHTRPNLDHDRQNHQPPHLNRATLQNQPAISVCHRGPSHGHPSLRDTQPPADVQPIQIV